MRRNALFILSLALCIVLSQVQPAAAFNSYRTAFRDYYSLASGDANYDASCTVCHPGGNTGQLNGYATDMLDALNQGNSAAEAIAAIDLLDSDGDGILNGREVVWYDTLPGDATSFPEDPVGDTASSWGQVKALFK